MSLISTCKKSTEIRIKKNGKGQLIKKQMNLLRGSWSLIIFILTQKITASLFNEYVHPTIGKDMVQSIIKKYYRKGLLGSVSISNKKSYRDVYQLVNFDRKFYLGYIIPYFVLYWECPRKNRYFLNHIERRTTKVTKKGVQDFDKESMYRP